MNERWEVDLEGAVADIELAARLGSSEFEIRRQDDRYHIVSPRFTGGAGNVKRQAEELVATIWITLHSLDDQVGVIRTGSVREMTSPTTWNLTLFAAPAEATARMGVPTLSGGIARLDSVDERARRVELALSNPTVMSGLTYLAESDWVGLWKAYEIVRRAAGGEDALIAKWTTKADASRFRQTANYEQRHADGVVAKPSSPMTLAEGQSYVRSILNQWLRDQFGA